MKVFFIPDHANDHHPLSTRSHSLIVYLAIFLILNFFIFPFFGIKESSVLAYDLSPEGIINTTNNERINRGLHTLVRNPLLDAAALAKGKDMFKKQYWSHYGPNGENPWQFILGSGYDYLYAGENLAKDFSDNDDVVRAWMNSTTHRNNILNPNFFDIGIAIMSGKLNGRQTTIIVQLFGHRNPQVTSRNPVDIQSYKPKIIFPQNKSRINGYTVDVTGESLYGDSVLIYANDFQIGEIPHEGGMFSTRITLPQENNRLEIQAKNSYLLEFSSKSDPIELNVVPDTSIDPNAIIVDIFGSEGKYKLITRSSSTLDKVIATINGRQFILAKNGYEFSTVIDSLPSTISITYHDIYGHKLDKEIVVRDHLIEQINYSPSKNITLGFDTSSNSFHLFNKNFSLKDIINIAAALVVLFLITIDAFFTLKKGLFRQWTSHLGFHFSLILFILVAVWLI